jgi:ATP-dependent helicase/DNAse subunit B
MAVIARNPEDRRGMIEVVFDAAGIPYFFSEKTDLSATAPARLVLSALRCVQRNYCREDVINLIKTGLCGLDIRKANLFEDYCKTWNINGKLYTQSEPWSMNADGYTTDKSDRGKDILKAANDVKKQLIPPLLALENELKAAALAAKCEPSQLVRKIEQLQEEIKTLNAENSQLKNKMAQEAMGDVMSQCVDVCGFKYLPVHMKDVDMQELMNLGDSLKAKLGEGVILLASEKGGKVSLLAMATDAAMKKGAHAGNLIKAVARLVGGGGGGRPNMAQAGGKNPAGIEEALQAGRTELEKQLNK